MNKQMIGIAKIVVRLIIIALGDLSTLHAPLDRKLFGMSAQPNDWYGQLVANDAYHSGFRLT